MDIYNQILDENELKYHKINDEIFKEVLTEFFEKVDASYELKSDMDYTDTVSYTHLTLPTIA